MIKAGHRVNTTRLGRFALLQYGQQVNCKGADNIAAGDARSHLLPTLPGARTCDREPLTHSPHPEQTRRRLAAPSGTHHAAACCVRRRQRMTARLPTSSGSQNAKLDTQTSTHRRSPKVGPHDPPPGTRNRGRTAPEPPHAGEPHRTRTIRRSRPACTAQRMPKTAGLPKPLAIPHPHRSNTTLALPRRTLDWRPIIRQRPRRRPRQPVPNRRQPTANRAEPR
jgi:hypothetical protein